MTSKKKLWHFSKVVQKKRHFFYFFFFTKTNLTHVSRSYFNKASWQVCGLELHFRSYLLRGPIYFIRWFPKMKRVRRRKKKRRNLLHIIIRQSISCLPLFMGIGCFRVPSNRHRRRSPYCRPITSFMMRQFSENPIWNIFPRYGSYTYLAFW